MQQNISYNIYVMSYRRSDTILTKHLFHHCTYVVRESEAEAYKDAGIDEMLVIPNGATLKCGAKVNDFITTFYWIIENTPEDVIAILDDDLKSYKYRRDIAIDIYEELEDPKDVVEDELLRLAQLLVDLDLGFLFTQPAYQLYNYTQEFCFKGMTGSTRIINKAAWKCKYVPGDEAMSDIDMVYQELLMNRIVLQPRYFHGVTPPTLLTKGGTEDSSSSEKLFRIAMKNKWGRYYDFDFKKNQTKINVKR